MIRDPDWLEGTGRFESLTRLEGFEHVQESPQTEVDK